MAVERNEASDDHPSASAPEISVVIPTRDRWELLQTTLLSALGQEDVELEVIVVDDGSVDETPARLMQCDDPRLVVLRNAESQGVAGARNRGIKSARGRWIAFLDHDDLWAPSKLRAQIDHAAEEEADFAYSAVVVVDSDCVPLRTLRPAPPQRLRAGLAAGSAVLPAGTSNVVARAPFIRALKGFDEHFAIFADWEMWIRMAWAGRPAALEDVHVAYRLNPETMTSLAVDCSSDLERMLRLHGPPRLNRRSAATYAARWKANALRRRGRRLPAAREYLLSAVRTGRPEMLARAVAVLAGERVMGLRNAQSRTEVNWLAPYRSSPTPGRRRAPDHA
jgi:hypothetical protein